MDLRDIISRVEKSGQTLEEWLFNFLTGKAGLPGSDLIFCSEDGGRSMFLFHAFQCSYANPSSQIRLCKAFLVCGTTLPSLYQQ